MSRFSAYEHEIARTERADMDRLKVLFLDDMHERHDRIAFYVDSGSPWDLTPVWTAEQAIEALNAAVYDVASLDHDLGPAAYAAFSGGHGTGDYSTEKTGLDVVNHIVSMPPEKRPKHVIVHSWNTVRGPVMVSELQKAGISAVYKPFGR